MSLRSELLVGTKKQIRFLYNGSYGVATDENVLYYMRVRYYNSDIKRFINQDIKVGDIGSSQSLNRYAYCEGNPVSQMDPFGLSPQSGNEGGFKWTIHNTLDVLGLFWDGADLINAAIYAKEGNWVEAGKCVACALPFIGTAIAGVTKGSKIAKVGKTVGTVLKAAGKTYMTAEAAKTSLELAGDAKMQYAVEGKVSASLVAKTAGAVAMAGVAALSGVSLMKDVRSLSKAAEVSFSTRIQKNAEIDAGQSVSKASNGVSQGASGVSVTSGEIAPASIRKMSDGPMVTAGKRGSDFYVTSGGTASPKENYHSMSNVDVRKWYLSQEAKIPELIDTSLLHQHPSEYILYRSNN